MKGCCSCSNRSKEIVAEDSMGVATEHTIIVEGVMEKIFNLVLDDEAMSRE
jgi:hypothetical protein